MAIDRISNYRQVRVLIYPHQRTERSTFSVMARHVVQGTGRDQQLAKGTLDYASELGTTPEALRYIAAVLLDAAERL